MVVALLGWIVLVNFVSNGDPTPLPFVPLLNPLDLAQSAGLLAIAMWYVSVRRLALPTATLLAPPSALAVAGGVSFIALNGMLLRTLHHCAGVPFDFSAMTRSVLVQAAFSLFWTLLAVIAMFYAARARLRTVWIVGAALLGVVVLKLLLIDLANSGTVGRIVSFMGVGVLTMAIGYFAPVPPKAEPVA